MAALKPPQMTTNSLLFLLYRIDQYFSSQGFHFNPHSPIKPHLPNKQTTFHLDHFSTHPSFIHPSFIPPFQPQLGNKQFTPTVITSPPIKHQNVEKLNKKNPYSVDFLASTTASSTLSPPSILINTSCYNASNKFAFEDSTDKLKPDFKNESLFSQVLKNPTTTDLMHEGLFRTFENRDATPKKCDPLLSYAPKQQSSINCNKETKHACCNEVWCFCEGENKSKFTEQMGTQDSKVRIEDEANSIRKLGSDYFNDLINHNKLFNPQEESKEAFERVNESLYSQAMSAIAGALNYPQTDLLLFIQASLLDAHYTTIIYLRDKIDNVLNKEGLPAGFGSFAGPSQTTPEVDANL